MANITAFPLQRRASMKDTMANGECVPCLGVLHGADFSIDGEAFQADLFALALVGYNSSSAPSGSPRWALSYGTLALAQCHFGIKITTSAVRAWQER